MAGRKRWREIHDLLFAQYGMCHCPLVHDSPFQLMTAVMLSAQCRDDRVNQVTKELFSEAPNAERMSKLAVSRIEELIHSCGLYKNKASNLSAAAKMIAEEFGGELPRTMEGLTRLPGIGRKSANVLLGNCFAIPGFPVDTHVTRVLNRIGVVESRDPVAIEKENNAKVPAELWTNFSHLLIQHGRQVCHAGKPVCQECVLSRICAKRGVK